MDKRIQFEDLGDIIKFAIEKEQEAVDFYTNLLAVAKSQAVAEEIRNIVKMEERHRDSLKEIDVKAYARNLNDPAVKLRIADYVVEAEPSPDMSLQDLLNIAMHRERKATELYTDLSKLFSEDEKQLFENLAAEENRHTHIFEGKWIAEVGSQNLGDLGIMP